MPYCLTAINGNIAVSGSGPFTVNFLGALANSSQPQLVLVSNSLTGTSTSVSIASTNNTGSIAAFANYKTSLASAGSTDNVRITASETLAANLDVNGLLIVNNATVNPTVTENNGTSNFTLTIGSGALVVTSNNAANDVATITGELSISVPPKGSSSPTPTRPIRPASPSIAPSPGPTA